jgi:hypothetical protein
MFGLSTEANPRAALAALRGIDVRIVGSRERGGQFALPLPAPGGTAFHRESFGVLRRGAARGSPEGIHVGRMTSCAHRLRKPDRTSQPLTSSVARRPRARSLLVPRPGGRPPQSLRHARGLRRARLAGDRRRVRTAESGRTRTPSIGSTRTLRPGWASRVRCSRSRPAPHPVACRDPGPASSKADWSLQTIPTLPCAR